MWRSEVSHMTPSFANVLEGAIQFHPRDRFSDAKTMRDALEGNSNMPSTVVSSPPSHSLPATQLSTQPPTTTATGKNGMGEWQKAVLSGGIIGVCIFAGLMGSLHLLNSGEEVAETTEPTEADKKTKATPYQSPQRSPKDVIKQYYSVAPTNRDRAQQLLSPAWEKVSLKEGEASFWDYVNEAEIYAMKTLAEQPDMSTIRVWLKYYMTDSYETRCEARTFDVVLYESAAKKQWLLEDSYNVLEKPGCSI